MEEAELDEGFASPSKIKLEKETVQKYFPKIKNPKVSYKAPKNRKPGSKNLKKSKTNVGEENIDIWVRKNPKFDKKKKKENSKKRAMEL